MGCCDFVGNRGKRTMGMIAICVAVMMLLTSALAESELQNGSYPDCTWAEYNEMTEEQQFEFYSSFEDPEDFDDWMYNAYMSSINDLPYPDKNPSEYTLEEFEGLNEMQREVFCESFESAEEFEAWLRAAQDAAEKSRYCTYAEFEAMDAARQDEYAASFGSDAAFEMWLDNAIVNSVVYEGKQLYEYSLEEADNMELEQQTAFFAAFIDDAAIDSWLAFEQWKINRSEPDDECTWSEFLAMDESQQEAFYRSFESEEAFDTWQMTARIFAEKNHYEYTWEEFEALDAEQQAIFPGLFESEAAFESWMDEARN